MRLACQDLLHNERIPPDVSNLRLLSALFNGVTSHPLHFLLLPSFVAFVAPTDWLWWIVPSSRWSASSCSCTAVSPAAGSRCWCTCERWFLVGTPLVMSLAVILIALLRLLGVQYVSTVLDATPVGVLFIFIVMMYVAFWFFEYWVNRWLGEEMLEVLGADRKPLAGLRALRLRAALRARPGPASRGASSRCTARAASWRRAGSSARVRRRASSRRTTPSRTYGFVELFEALGANQEQGEDFAHDIRRRVHLYFTLVNILLVAAAVGLFYWHLNWSRPLAVEPMVRANAILPEQVTDAQLQAQARANGRHAAPAPARTVRAAAALAGGGGLGWRHARGGVHGGGARGHGADRSCARRGVAERRLRWRRLRRGVRQPIRHFAHRESAR